MADAALSVIRPGQYRLPVQSLTAGMAMVQVAYTFTDSYSTGGDPFSLTTGEQNIEVVLLNGSQGYTFSYDPAGGKMLAYTTAATEAAPATDLSALGAIPGVAFVVGRQRH